MSVEEIYQKKTPLEHILLRPDTYVGSVEPELQNLWVLSQDSSKFVQNDVMVTPAMFKIFDEILVNAADNYRRDNSMNKLEVVIDQEMGFISVCNNGKGIPVLIHKQFLMYVPELIFGHLLTGSNYNDSEKKVTGGRNGYGAKLSNIFSTKFIVEAADSVNGSKFLMEWTNNMTSHSDAQITAYSGRDYTRITLFPDFRRFKMEKLDDGLTAFLKKRVYDIAGVLGGAVKVSLNKQPIKIKSFSDYVDMYLEGDDPIKVCDKESNNEHWQVIVSTSDSQFKQVSFVNSICTFRGGTHVSMLADQIVQKIQEQIKKKYKDLQIKPYQVKSHLWIFVNSLIQNPAFDSQTKETLTTKPTQFGSTFSFSDKAIKQILKTGIIDHIVNEAKAKELNKLAKVTGGGKKAKVVGIPKLEDANEAGSKNSQKCTLILTEGDSAKSLAMSGLQVVGRDYFGVFPLKGKLLNAREATNKQIMENQEIQNLIKIVGLQIGKTYEDLKSLRYGSIMIMSDQDTDGSHIKGLIINFIHHFWPSLIRTHNGFVKCFITPIIKTIKGDTSNIFYSLHDYDMWLESVNNVKGWKIKYYKGLGTSTDKEAQEYFSNLERNKIVFEYVDQEDDDSIDLCFNKKKAEHRKKWLENYNASNVVDFTNTVLRYKDFVNKQLIHFSNSDNRRSIPSVCDGLKPGQRKVLYACFKRNLKEEIKVAQLAGYVAQQSAYHHGEMSLCQTIIGMAQDFVGSNNINLLMPIGQFGSRNHGGKEHASSRYIFTSLSKLTRLLFPEADDHILKYEEDDGQLVEPQHYVPIIPMVLINGAQGIGTGWSTYVPQFSPRQICQCLKKKLNGEPMADLNPFYKGYQGTITRNEAGGYVSVGKAEQKEGQPNVVNITQLPLHRWTRDYKNFLQEMMTDKEKQSPIDSFKEYHTKNRVNFQVTFNEGVLENWSDSLTRNLKLISPLSMNNLVLFNSEGRLQRYKTVVEIMEQFYEVRHKAYVARKEYQLSKIKKDLQILQNKTNFILEVVNQTIMIRNVKKITLCQLLMQKKYLKASEFHKVQSTKSKNQKKADESDKEDEPETPLQKEYDYLLTMPLWSLTEEMVDKLKAQLQRKKGEYEQLDGMNVCQMWTKDIDDFLEMLQQVEAEEERDRLSYTNNEKEKGKKKNKPKKKKQQR